MITMSVTVTGASRSDMKQVKRVEYDKIYFQKVTKMCQFRFLLVSVHGSSAWIRDIIILAKTVSLKVNSLASSRRCIIRLFVAV